MSIKIRYYLTILLTSATFPISATSPIILEDFDLDDNTVSANGAAMAGDEGLGSEMEKCLLDQAHCSSDELRSATDFTIEELRYLGIIDPEPVVQGIVAQMRNTPTISPLPSIDLEIQFDYNSDMLRPDQYPKLKELAQVLSGDRFRSFHIAFLGHSDAKGSQAYNLELSRRRAKAVSDFVSGIGGLPPDRLIVAGLGSRKLKNPSDPFGSQNRRVQVLLISQSQVDINL